MLVKYTLPEIIASKSENKKSSSKNNKKHKSKIMTNMSI